MSFLDKIKAKAAALQAATQPVENQLVETAQPLERPAQEPAELKLETDDAPDDDLPEYAGVAGPGTFRTEAAREAPPQWTGRPVEPEQLADIRTIAAREARDRPLQRRHDAMAEARELIEAYLAQADADPNSSDELDERARAWLDLPATK